VGKPFATELSYLADTIAAARALDVGLIKRFFDNAAGQTVFAVGVGGSFTAARFAALLHSRRGGIGLAQTTYDFCDTDKSLRHAHVILFTGGGANRDILNAFDCAIFREARSVLVICASLKTAIAARVRRFWYAAIVEFRVPTGRDGFLATNTLLATCTLLARAFKSNVKKIDFHHRAVVTAADAGYRLAADARDQLIVLGGGYGMPAAVDLESKCSETALASVMLSDYRHFAHGRHVWLAKRPSTVAVIAFVTPNERDIFNSTRALIPSSVPVVRLASASSDSCATIKLLCQVFYLVAGLGNALGRDPGRPGVPGFGRRIYHLNVGQRFAPARISRKGVERVACERKRIVGGDAYEWDTRFARFLDNLHQTWFTAVVFDFDGTLCGAKDRFAGVTKALTAPLNRLLSHGVRVMIATGRGDSCRESLRNVIPQAYWNRVIVGYHNGSDVATLADASFPAGHEVPVDALARLVKMIKLRKLAKSDDLRLHRCQLTIKANGRHNSGHIAHGIEEIIAGERLPLRLVYSSHSFDVLACEATKINVLQRGLSKDDKALCIGDRGDWPGNDFELLRTPLSLSVDEVSGDPNTCWNIAPAGVRCEQATLFYLLGMKANRGLMTFSLKRSLRWFRSR
jgi:fructoselysine-6-P-deglycase FrlB-like protein